MGGFKPYAFLLCPSLPYLRPKRRFHCHAQLNGPDGLPNARDLSSAAPSLVRSGRLYRGATPAALPDHPNPEVLKFLRSTVSLVDLRSRDERRLDRRAAMAWACGPDFDLRERHVGLLNKRRVVWGLTRVLPRYQLRDLAYNIVSNPLAARLGVVNRMDQGGLILLNQILVEAGASSIARAMSIITDGVRHGIVYFYCSAGKDRTGLLAALILTVLGVEERDVIFDYAKSSETWLNGPYHIRSEYSGKLLLSKTGYGSIRLVRACVSDCVLCTPLSDTKAIFVCILLRWKERLEQAGLTPSIWIGSPPEVMQETLLFIKRRYGSVEDYLIRYGFDEKRMSELREAMRPEG